MKRMRRAFLCDLGMRPRASNSLLQTQGCTPQLCPTICFELCGHELGRFRFRYPLYWFTALSVAGWGDDVAARVPYWGFDNSDVDYEGVRVLAFDFIYAGLIVNDMNSLPWLQRPRRIFQLFQAALLASVAAHNC